MHGQRVSRGSQTPTAAIVASPAITKWTAGNFWLCCYGPYPRGREQCPMCLSPCTQGNSMAWHGAVQAEAPAVRRCCMASLVGSLTPSASTGWPTNVHTTKRLAPGVARLMVTMWTVGSLWLNHSSPHPRGLLITYPVCTLLCTRDNSPPQPWHDMEKLPTATLAGVICLHGCGP